MATEESGFRGRLPMLGMLGAVVLIVAVIVWAIVHFSRGGPPPGPKVQMISVVQPPPPKPPEEKPPEEKPPEEKIETKMEQTPVEKPEEPPTAAQPLETGPGESAYGQGGGKNFIPGDGDGSGSRFGWYAGLLQQTIQDALSRDGKINKTDYKVMVKIWVSANGTVKQVEVYGSSGQAETDVAIEKVLAHLSALREPPEDMPQPIKLRITSRQ